MPPPYTLEVLYSTDDVSDATPTWVDASADVRGFSISRGRSTELSRVDAGTATLLLNNRERTYDQVVDPLIRPMNRWWIKAINGATEIDLFVGYAESYTQGWVKGSEDATTTVNLVDEFKVLALDKLPTTDPPRDTYQDLVMFDTPQGYWPMDNAAVTMAESAAIGESLTAVGAMAASASSTGVSGQRPHIAGILTSTGYWTTKPLEPGETGDAGGLAEFTCEGLFRVASGAVASAETLMSGPPSGGTWTWKLGLDTSGHFTLDAKNSAGTNHSLASTTISTVFCHVVGTITGGSLRLYVNGVQEASTAWTGVFGVMDAGGAMKVGNHGVSIGAATRIFDELAFYRAGLSAARVAAHYTAAFERGFPATPASAQQSIHRVEDVLDAVGSIAPRLISASGNQMMPEYMRGQSPLDLIRQAEAVEAPDGLFFVGKDGTLTFLTNGHRSGSPWNTVQATFGEQTGALRTNRLTNPSIETNTNGWAAFTGGGTLTRVTSEQVYGESSLKFDMTAVGNGPQYTSPAGQAIPASTAVTVSCYFKGTAGQTYELQALVTHTDASVVGSGSINFVATGSFQRATASVSTSVGKTGDIVRLLLYKRAGVGANTAGADTVYVDGAMIEVAAAAGSYFDGDILGRWTGTPHASSSLFGAEIPYQDIGVDYSDSFIANDWNVTRQDGLLQTATDATSVGRYFQRSQAISDLPLVNDATALTMASQLLAKYKDPLTRINRLEITSADGDITDIVFDRDIGDRIRVLRTPPGGGARIDQTVFIQHITIDGTPGVPWRVVWGLSPL